MQTSQLPILVILSNNPYVCHFYREKLEDEFFVMDFSSAESTLDCVKMLHTAAILVDKKFSEEILEICRKIQEEKRSKKAPIFLITNDIKQSFLQKATQAGVNNFLNLPLSIVEFREKFEFFEKNLTTNNKLSLQKEKMHFWEDTEAPLRHIFTSQTTCPIQDGYLLYISIEENFYSFESFLEKHLRNFDEILLAENDTIIVFLPKTSERAAFSIAEIIQAESPVQIIIGGIKVAKWGERTLLDARKKGQEMTERARENHQKITFAE